MALAVLLQVARLQRGRGIAYHAYAARLGGNHMAHHRDVLPGHGHAAAFLVQSGKGLGAGVLVHQVQIAEQKNVLFVQSRDRMRVDQFLIKRSWGHGGVN
ncbi:hypothetical protein D3C78_1628730 [compost metagenome]